MSDIGQVFLRAYKTLPEQDQQELLNAILREPGAAWLVDRTLLPNLISEKLSIQTTETPPTPQRPLGRLPYDAPGRLSGMIREYQISVLQLSRRRFRTIIDGNEYTRLYMEFVEGQLGLQVNRKEKGRNSETLARAIYRHLVDRYNDGNETVTWEPSNL